MVIPIYKDIEVEISDIFIEINLIYEKENNILVIILFSLDFDIDINIKKQILQGLNFVVF